MGLRSGTGLREWGLGMDLRRGNGFGESRLYAVGE
jgi:hypothetical protein